MEKRIYSILDFGVEKDVDIVQTVNFQKAIDYCYLNGGGEIIIPKGDYYIGGIRIRSNVKLHLMNDAHLMGSRNPLDYFGFLNDEIEKISQNDKTDVLWKSVAERKNHDHINKPASRWNNAVIRGIDAHNIAIIGEEGSYIDGRDCFDELGEERYRGPHAVNLHRCSNIELYGYEIKNSANWAHALFDCKNVKVKNVSVIAGHDGIHLTTCDNVLINSCSFQCGDDCIAGIDNLNISISDCYLNSACSGMRFGGTNIVVENCKFIGPAKYLFRGSLSEDEKKKGIIAKGDHRYNMLSAYTYYADDSRNIRYDPGNIMIKNCVFKNTDRFLHYNFSGNEPWQRSRPLSSIRFENIRAEGIKKPLIFYGDQNNKASIEIADTFVEFSEKAETSFMQLCNFDKVVIKNVTVKNAKSSPLLKKWSNDGDIIIENLNCTDYQGEIENMADEDFECTPI